MQRHYLVLTLLTAFIIAGAAFGGYMSSRYSGLPMSIHIVDAHTALIGSIEGIPLPAGIQAGDRFDPAEQPPATRIALSITKFSSYTVANIPLGRTYDFVIERNDAVVMVPIATVYLSEGSGAFLRWMAFIGLVLFAGLALLALWRGHDRAAVGFAIWTIAILTANVLVYPLDGTAGIVIQVLRNLGFLLGRVGFFIMADAVARPILSPRIRALYLGVFITVLIAGAATFSIGGPILYTSIGWTQGLMPQTGLIWTCGYLIPVLLLFSSYRHANLQQRLRLRWMLWSGVIFLGGIFLSNSPILGWPFSSLCSDILQDTGTVGFLYVVLRYRVVDVSVILDSTLVYGGMTALVVGVLAAVNSLVERAALGSSASLLVQVVVPLSLGIVLTRLRTYLDRIVERVFFRKKYLASKALRRFARHSVRYESVEDLITTAAQEIQAHLGARCVAIYERQGENYKCVQRIGEPAFPPRIKIDDSAFVAARTEHKDVDLSELASDLGNDGFLFPMTALGSLQAVLVCNNRPGERYSSEERKLLAYVSHQTGIAFFALRMQAKARLIDSLASGALTSLPEIQAQARTLASGPSL